MARPEGAEEEEAEAWPPLTRVVLRGLARAELNGTVAVVLAAGSPGEAEKLRETGRVRVSGYPRPLALRPENLAAAPEADFATPPLPFTALEVVRGGALVCELSRELGEDFEFLREVAATDEPFQLAASLWRIYAGAAPAPPARLPKDVSAVVLDTPGHWLYWLGLDQIDHQLVLEACDGTYLCYQAARRVAASEAAGMQSHAGVVLQVGEDKGARGYTSGQWAAADTAIGCAGGDDADAAEEAPPGEPGTELDCSEIKVEHVDPEAPVLEIPRLDSEAHRRFGGGRQLNRSEAEAFLRLVSDLSGQAKVLAGHLRQQIGAPTDEAASEWAQAALGRSQGEGVILNPDKPVTPRAGEADLVFLFSGHGVTPAFDLSLPTRLAFPFMRKYAQLVGEYPTGDVFLKILEYIDWEVTDLPDGGCCGWTLRRVDLRSDRR